MTDGARLARAPIGLVALLSVALLVNYVDRGSIATAAPLLEQELGLVRQPDGLGPGGLLLGVRADAARDGLARGSLRSGARTERWISAVESRDRGERPRRRSRHAGPAAPADGRWRGHVLPERAQPAVATRAAAATRPRDRDDAVRRGRRAGHRHAARWAAHGSLRMAGDVHRHGPRLAALAHCVAALDAPLAAGPVAGGCGRQSALRTDPAAARAVGRHDGDVLLQLCVLLRVLVAAAVPGPRARPLARRR